MGPRVQLLHENVRSLIGLAVGFVVVTAVSVLADSPTWAKLGAAALILVSLVLIAGWLSDPWSSWLERRGRRLVLAAAPAAAAALILLVGARLGADGATDFSLPATLLLIDTSLGMGDASRTGQTKLEEAVRLLGQHVRDLGNDQLGLATFGVASCEQADPPVNVLVEIAAGRGEAIRSVATRLQPVGESNLVSAARYAIGLLNPFTDDRVRVLIVTGGLGDCAGSDTLEDVLREAELKGVRVQWELVGFGLSPEEQSDARGLPGLDVFLAETSEELDDVLRFLLFQRPIEDELDTLRSYVEGDVRTSINDAIAATNASDWALVRERLADVEALTQYGQDRFDDFATDDEALVFRPMKELLRMQFELQVAVIPAVRAVADFDEAHGDGALDRDEVTERNELLRAINEITGEYNSNLSTLSELTEAALDELFGGG